MIHHVVTVGDGGREAEVLLHQQHREAALLDLADGAADLLHDHRRQPFGRLVEQQHLGPGAQDARDRQHLLLAARQLGALGGVGALLQVRKKSVDGVEVEAARGHHRRQHHVLGNRQRPEDAALLRADGDAGAGDGVGRQPDRLDAAIGDAALAPRHQTHDGLHRRGLAGAVSPEQGHHLALAHLKIDAVQHMAFAIPGIESRDLKHARFPDRR